MLAQGGDLPVEQCDLRGRLVGQGLLLGQRRFTREHLLAHLVAQRLQNGQLGQLRLDRLLVGLDGLIGGFQLAFLGGDQGLSLAQLFLVDAHLGQGLLKLAPFGLEFAERFGFGGSGIRDNAAGLLEFRLRVGRFALRAREGGGQVVALDDQGAELIGQAVLGGDRLLQLRRELADAGP